MRLSSCIRRRGFLVLLATVIAISAPIATAAVTIDYWSIAPDTTCYDFEEYPVEWTDELGEGLNDFKHMIADFERLNPGIKVQLTPVDLAKRLEKLVSAVVAGEAPDLSDQVSWHVPVLAERGILSNLDDFGFPKIETVGAETDYMMMYEGGRYQFPYAMNTFALIYNTDSFEAAGLPTDREEWTWEELNEWGEKLYEFDSDGNITKVGFAPWLAGAIPWDWYYVFGGNIWDRQNEKLVVNSAQNIACLEWYDSWMEKFGRDNMLKFWNAAIQSMQVAGGSPLYTGDLAISHSGSYYPRHMLDKWAPDLNWKTVPFPYPPGGRAWSGALVAATVTMPAGAEHPEEALKLLEYLYVDNIPSYTSSGIDPPIDKRWVDWYKAHSPRMDVFTDLVFSPGAVAIPMIPIMNLPKWAHIEDARDYVLHGKKTAKQALDDLQNKLQSELDIYWGDRT